MSPRRTIRRIHAADFEQLEPEGLDLGEHAVQRGLVRQRSDQHGVGPAPLSPQGGKAERIVSPRWPRTLISYCCAPPYAPVT
jgi:hypothetical protein